MKQIFVLQTEQAWEVHRAGTMNALRYPTLAAAKAAAEKIAAECGATLVYLDGSDAKEEGAQHAP